MMKRYSILTENRAGVRKDTGFILQATDKQAALTVAERMGFPGKLIAAEILDAECPEVAA